MLNINEPSKQVKVNKQQTIHGRKLEYPAPERRINVGR
jgi:hypothetical protein